MGEISVKTGNNARNGGKNSLNRLIRCVCGKKIGPDPRNFNQRVSLGRNDLLIRTFPSHPACIRLRDGSFSHFNHSFATTFLHNINVNIWFNRLEISSSLRLSALDAEVYSGDRKMLIEENLPINGNRWDFIIERMSFDGTEFTLWKFCHLQRGGFLLSPVRSGFIKKLNEFKNALGFLTDVQIETLALYSFGASHNQISEVLNIAVGTSKNRVNRILAALPIRTREEVFYFLFASGMAFSFCKVVTELIGSRVNKLLTKEGANKFLI
ncbi:conjugal transfer protein TraJ [Klebsiella pneumoniae]